MRLCGDGQSTRSSSRAAKPMSAILATVLGGVDRGYRVVLAANAVCSSSDETHDGLLTLYEKRYSEQVKAVTSDIMKANWLDA